MILRNMFNPNPFFYNNDFSEDDYDDNIYSLTQRNENLINVRNSNTERMNEEQTNLDNFYSYNNKLRELDIEVKESIYELSNVYKQCENEKKVQIEKYKSDLIDIIRQKKKEELKKENYLKKLEMQIANEKEKNKKLIEAKKLRKRAKQNEMLRQMENENKIQLLKYEKEKEMKKEEMQKQFELRQKKIETEDEIELNELKNKSELADKLIYLFDNKYI